jgi:hypothetical protein
VFNVLHNLTVRIKSAEPDITKPMCTLPFS